MDPQWPTGMRGVDDADRWAKAIAEAVGPGWRVEREPRPPYGWNLISPTGGEVIASGPLERLDRWAKTHQNQTADPTP